MSDTTLHYFQDDKARKFFFNDYRLQSMNAWTASNVLDLLSAGFASACLRVGIVSTRT